MSGRIIADIIRGIACDYYIGYFYETLREFGLMFRLAFLSYLKLFVGLFMALPRKPFLTQLSNGWERK